MNFPFTPFSFPAYYSKLHGLATPLGENIMGNMKKIITASLVTVSLAACAEQGSYGAYNSSFGSTPTINKQTIGTLAGGAAGAVAGSNIGKGKGRVAAVAIGTLLGAAVGGQIGKSLDNADKAAMYNTSQNAFETAPTGRVVEWRNPDSGNYGTYTPIRTYNDNGTHCREFTQTIVVGGKTERGYGTACRRADGTWQIQS